MNFTVANLLPAFLAKKFPAFENVIFVPYIMPIIYNVLRSLCIFFVNERTVALIFFFSDNVMDEAVIKEIHIRNHWYVLEINKG